MALKINQNRNQLKISTKKRVAERPQITSYSILIIHRKGIHIYSTIFSYRSYYVHPVFQLYFDSPCNISLYYIVKVLGWYCKAYFSFYSTMISH